MGGFNFERDLPHQIRAVESIVKLFDDVGAKELPNKLQANYSNPSIKFSGNKFYENLTKVQEYNCIDKKYYKKGSNVLDISMETGTGKTYTYTKMMFELNKHLNQSKFIVIVPTLSIKAGTISFLNSKATKDHFRQEYKREIKTYIVESNKNKKSKKNFMPQAIRDFVVEDSLPNKKIHILIVNQGMINSETMSQEYDVNLLDGYSNPFKAIASLQPIAIIDEPHKFKIDNKTWKNIEKFEAQWIIRYGATFDNKEENLLYKLSAVDAFNQDLVKGVVTYVEEFSGGQNAIVKLKRADSSKAIFELIENNKTKEVIVAKKDSMIRVHKEMTDLIVDNLKKNVVLLSNGLEVNTKTYINPYSYSESIQDKMIQKTIINHFELEKRLLTREVKIKPLTLFFIDDIEGYRDGNEIAGSLKTKFEALLKGHIKKLLKSETNDFYRDYLKKSLKNISLTHGGYFSKDNSESSEEIEKEINEILHDKEELLSLDNPRRFIFSKWTLREGWDNPNVFQICKLRSSGSATSKLQEVGRGLRLPVNEFMSRVKEEQFELNYYVDFTEKDFAQSLVDEINSKSKSKDTEDPISLTYDLIDTILKNYNEYENRNELYEVLVKEGIIKYSHDFENDGFNRLREKFPAIFESKNTLNNNKVRNANKESKKTTIRVGKYFELKELWEAMNQKVILEYKIENENIFHNLLKNYLKENSKKFKEQGIETHKSVIEFEQNVAYYKEIESVNDEILPISYMRYNEFLIELATKLRININTLHKVFYELKNEFNINLYLNMQTIRTIKMGFNKYLLDNAITNFNIKYNKISNSTCIHRTELTDEYGNPYKNIDSYKVGDIKGNSSDKVATNYFFEEVFFDSELERENIITEIEQVTVFTKIPKKSIKIPVAGGGTYSPDFAYIVKNKDGRQNLNFIVETKNKEERCLNIDEDQKIKHAQEFFKNINSNIEVTFKTQFKGEKIIEIIKSLL
ncbi:type III restriction-modification system endonuclease [Aliarcobacter cryaerophilus]|uniref:type III restriction-modification system endonuclease n=1 Tax=Aliarcobacter cryaerophilus TaxID=28198 RepID=UPI003DA3183A